MPNPTTLDELRQKVADRPVIEFTAAGMNLRVKAPTTTDWSEIRQQLIAANKDGNGELLAAAECRALGLLCDEQGRKWLTDDQVEGFMEGNAAVVSQIAERVLEVTGLNDDGLSDSVKT